MASKLRSSSEPRRVLIVNIEKGSAGLFGVKYQGLLQLLNNNPLLQVAIVNSVGSLQTTFSEMKPNVLLFVNELVATRPNLKGMVGPFVSGGGMVVLGGQFSSSTKPNDMNKFFSSLGLPWESSACNRTTFGITNFGKSVLTGVDEQFSVTALQHSVKALQLANVTPEQALYTPLAGAKTECYAFRSKPTDPSVALAALARIGAGAISFVGDGNAGEASNRLTVALCLTNY